MLLQKNAFRLWESTAKKNQQSFNDVHSVKDVRIYIEQLCYKYDRLGNKQAQNIVQEDWEGGGGGQDGPLPE